ncbi:hypothetical protein UlMin_033563 [Ulmus minor]
MGTIPPSRTNCAYTPSHAPELCLPTVPSTQADIMNQGPASTDINHFKNSLKTLKPIFNANPDTFWNSVEPDQNRETKNRKLEVAVYSLQHLIFFFFPFWGNSLAFVYHSRHLYKVYLVAMVKKMSAYKNRQRALELECSRGSTNKKSNKKKEVDLSQELELQIKEAAKPSLWELVGVCFILLPCTIAKLLLWYGHWSWRYKVKKAPYSWEDASYLTQRALRVPRDAWSNIDETRKEDLVQRRLWVQSNLENYMAEMRKKSKRKR